MVVCAIPLNYAITTTVPSYNFDAAELSEVRGALMVAPGARNVAPTVSFARMPPMYMDDSSEFACAVCAYFTNNSVNADCNILVSVDVEFSRRGLTLSGTAPKSTVTTIT